MFSTKGRAMSALFKKLLFIGVLSFGLLSLSLSVVEAKTIYQQKNNPLNYVKIKKVKGGDADFRVTTHPQAITQEQMENYLSSLRISKSLLFRENFKDQRIFNDESIVKIAPHLVQAFQEVTPFEIVHFSIVVKDPLFIVRNDHLTQGMMWIHENELHVQFNKLHAKLQGDYKAHGNGKRIVRNAKGLRVSLEAIQGQKLSFDNAGEIILDMKAPWGQILAEQDRKDDLAKKEKSKWTFRKKKKEGLIRDQENPVNPTVSSTRSNVGAPSYKSSNNYAPSGSVESRLLELKKLKDQGLIDAADYNRKKAQILQNL